MYCPERVIRFLAPGASQSTYSHFLWFCVELQFSGICYFVGTRAPVLESLGYVGFRKWCSRAGQIAFHDCRKKLQNHVFSRIVHLASTRASVIAAHWCTRALVLESLFYVYVRKWCSGASQIAFHDCLIMLQNHVFSRIVHLAGTRALVLEWSHH